MASQPVSRKRRVPLQLSITDPREDDAEKFNRRCFSQKEYAAIDISSTECDSSIITPIDIYDTTSELMMCDRFVPRSSSDLAVHPAKIKELKAWIEHAKLGCDCLILTGPSGSGKSTAVRVLCSNLKVTLQEWDYDDIFEQNIASTAISTENELEQFFNFIRSRGNFVQDSPVIKLIEYLPVAAYTDTYSFRERIRYAVRRSPQSIIFCLSDVKSCLEVSPQKIFPSHFVTEEQYTSISFNAVAKTISYKALKRARDLLSTKRKISDAKLNKIVEMGDGDLRLCFNTMHFSLNSDGTLVDVDVSLRSVLCDDRFHMIGRILHAKREPAFLEPKPSWLLEHLHRPPPERDINDTLAMSAIDQHELVPYFHEYAPNFSPSLSSTVKILEAISFTDAMTDRWDVRLRIKEDHKDKTFRKMGEYESQVAARAVYFYNYNASYRSFSGFKRPKLKELEREIWNLSHELRNSINSCRLGFNTVIEQLAMLSNMRISVQRNQYELIKYVTRPFTWLWCMGRQHFSLKLRQVQVKDEAKSGVDVLISTSAFPMLHACTSEEETNIDEDNVIIDDSEEENVDDSFDEDPFD